jgi:hypothetical protein
MDQINMKHLISPNKSCLLITVDEDERKQLAEMEDIHSDKALHDFLEPLTGNSELEWVYPEHTGDLTDAPMLGITDNSDTPKIIARWAWMNYQVKSFLEALRDHGKAVLLGGEL